MGFISDVFSRAGRIMRGQANQAVSAAEDANFEATVRQTVADMKTELNKAVRASAMAMSNYNRLEAEYDKYARQSEEWKARAGKALDAGNEDLARKALGRKAECDRQVGSLQSSVDAARQSSETLKQQVSELKRKIDEGERTATTLVARKNAAQAQRKVSEALAGVGSADNAFAALGRFEESVAREEATAKAFNQIAETGQDPDLEKEFLALEGRGVDDELEKLKRERQLRPPEIPIALPSPGEKTAGR
ncbi:MAG TPA: PspA/IM30 family protein [Bryobacteraceae bacterium]|nr:PspA/IM30 family protein [Bryobacteraceae bacterium]